MTERTWQLHCPPGMLSRAGLVKQFTSAEAFDGYVRELRAQGFTVSFTTPWVAVVESRS